MTVTIVSLLVVFITLLLAGLYFRTQARNEKIDIQYQREYINDVIHGTFEGFYGYSDVRPFQRVARKSLDDRHERFHTFHRSLARFFFVSAGFLLIMLIFIVLYVMPFS